MMKTISPSLKCYRKRAQNFRAQGLTTKGTRFQRRPNFFTAADRLAARRERGLKAWLKLSKKHRLAGLTTRGHTKIPARILIGRHERLILITEIDAVAAALNDVFHLVPPVQPKLLALAHHLAALRTNL
ncbi:MAG: hypothetical protein P4N60_19275 [Verrucomicrobiae bacterium]|nr:hypothetical protein [Verrucomicrobiae bacterium]